MSPTSAAAVKVVLVPSVAVLVASSSLIVMTYGTSAYIMLVPTLAVVTVSTLPSLYDADVQSAPSDGWPWGPIAQAGVLETPKIAVVGVNFTHLLAARFALRTTVSARVPGAVLLTLVPGVADSSRGVFAALKTGYWLDPP